MKQEDDDLTLDCHDDFLINCGMRIDQKYFSAFDYQKETDSSHCCFTAR